MNRTRIITVIILMSCLPIHLLGNEGDISIVCSKLQQRGELVEGTLEITLKYVKLKTQQSIRITPILKGKNEGIELTPLLLNSPTKERVYERAKALKKGGIKERGILVSPLKYERIKYHFSTQYQPWMSHAKLTVKEDFCGCAGKIVPLISHTEALPITQQVIQLQSPAIVLIKPTAEAIKQRIEIIKNYLYFPINSAVLSPQFKNNGKELSKMNDQISFLLTNPHTDIKNIAVTGYCSPDGSWEFNNMLARKRAESMAKYIETTLAFPIQKIAIDAVSEDWEGIKKQIGASTLIRKKELLKAMENAQDWEEKKKSIAPYIEKGEKEYFNSTILPPLRRVDCKIVYIISQLTANEARKILNTTPQFLTLTEFYAVADGYKKGSKAYNDVYYTAAKTYPQSIEANLNAGAIALQQNNAELAEKYIDQVGKASCNDNNLGLLYLLKGETEKGKALLRKAAEKGCPKAKENLKAIIAQEADYSATQSMPPVKTLSPL